MAYVLTGEAAMSPAVAGGKGAALAKLAATFPVPAFFVIPAEAFDEAGLRSEAREEVKQGLQRLGAGPFAVRSSSESRSSIDASSARSPPA